MAAFGAKVVLTRTADTATMLANDIIGAATGSTAALTFSGIGGPPSPREMFITAASLLIRDTGVISGETSYRLYLYNVTPPSALGDNAPWDLPSGDRASFIGYIDLGTPVDIGSSLFVQTTQINTQISTLGSDVFGYLVTNGPYQPTSGRVYEITLHTSEAV